LLYARLYHKPLVSWIDAFVVKEGRVRDPVKPLVLTENQDRSVSMIRTLPLVGMKLEQLLERPSRQQSKGRVGLASSHLQAGVI
jgi:hypothetical protein